MHICINKEKSTIQHLYTEKNTYLSCTDNHTSTETQTRAPLYASRRHIQFHACLNPFYQLGYSQPHKQGERKREGGRERTCPPPVVSSWLLARKCSWWRTSLIKFTSVYVTLPPPIRPQDSECTLPCPLSSTTLPFHFQTLPSTTIVPSAGLSETQLHFHYLFLWQPVSHLGVLCFSPSVPWAISTSHLLCVCLLTISLFRVLPFSTAPKVSLHLLPSIAYNSEKTNFSIWCSFLSPYFFFSFFLSPEVSCYYILSPTHLKNPITF